MVLKNEEECEIKTEEKQVRNVRRVSAVKWAAVCEPCSSTALSVQHFHVSEGLAEQSACLSLIVFDSPVWQLMSRIKGGVRQRGR